MASPGLKRRLLLLFGSTLAGLLFVEGGVRAVSSSSGDKPGDEGWRRRISALNGALYRRSDDSRLIYEPARGASIETPYGMAQFNSAGMRDDREHHLARDGRMRIALVGDSIVWGEELPLEATLGSSLENELGRERVEVLNFGVSGYDTHQERVWYDQAVLPFRPQVVVVVYCLNDVMIMSGPFNRYATVAEARLKDEQDRYLEGVAPIRAETLDRTAREDERASAWKSLSRLRAMFQGWFYAASADYTDEYLIMYGRPDRVRRMERALAELGASIRATGAAAHLVVSPILRGWDNYRWRAIHAQVAAVGVAMGFVVHDPITDWMAEEDPERMGWDSLHYSRYGNTVLARSIATDLRASSP